MEVVHAPPVLHHHGWISNPGHAPKIARGWRPLRKPTILVVLQLKSFRTNSSICTAGICTGNECFHEASVVNSFLTRLDVKITVCICISCTFFDNIMPYTLEKQSSLHSGFQEQTPAFKVLIPAGARWSLCKDGMLHHASGAFEGLKQGPTRSSLTMELKEEPTHNMCGMLRHELMPAPIRKTTKSPSISAVSGSAHTSTGLSS